MAFLDSKDQYWNELADSMVHYVQKESVKLGKDLDKAAGDRKLNATQLAHVKEVGSNWVNTVRRANSGMMLTV